MSIRDVFSKAFLKYILQRVGQCIIVIFIGINIAFIIPRLAPTNPIELKINQMLTSGASNYPEAVQLFREAMYDLYGLKGSLGEQYLSFWKRFLQGNLGPSIFAYPRPVMDLIWNSMPWTIGLLLTTSLLSWIIGNLLGGLAGYYSEKRWTKWVELAANCVRPVPYYIAAFILLIVFCFLIPIFPTTGAYAPGLKEGWSIQFALSVLYHCFLPGLSLVIVSIGAWLLGMRSLVSNIISEDYVQYAEVGGVKRRTILSKYIMRNAMLPQITGLGMSLGGIFSGALITEYVFGIPGIGMLSYRAVTNFDYSLIMGVSIFSIVGVAVSALFVDLLYPIFDPRVRLS
ncbi:MAG: ABC transporter permease [Chloroflexi bacterium]|nr:ABC transporter permease [Chloroflexota bacterium]